MKSFAEKGVQQVTCRRVQEVKCSKVRARSDVQKSECTKECAEKPVQSDVHEGDVLRKCSAREGIL